MNDGAGSPTFFFYAPVPFYLSSLGFWICQTCETTTELGVGQWLLISSSGLSFYVFARRQTGKTASTIGAIVYALMPYHFGVDLWVRQAMGELAAYIFMPLILMYIDRIAGGQKGIVGLAVSYSLLVCSHLPSALLFSLLVPFYTFVAAPRRKLGITATKVFAGIAIGVLLASVYLAPALLSQQYVYMDRMWTSYYEYHRWFFFGGAENPDPSFARRILLVLVAETAVFFVAWYVAYRQGASAQRAKIFLWLTTVCVVWGMM